MTPHSSISRTEKIAKISIILVPFFMLGLLMAPFQSQASAQELSTPTATGTPAATDTAMELPPDSTPTEWPTVEPTGTVPAAEQPRTLMAGPQVQSLASTVQWPALDPDCSDGQCVYAVSSGWNDASTNPLYGACIERPTDFEVYMGKCPGGQDIYAGFRFVNLNLAQGTGIRHAYLVFTEDGPYDSPIEMNIYGEAGVVASEFVTSMPSQRTIINPYSPVDWKITDRWDLGKFVSPPEVTNIVQLIINQPNWVQDHNALAFILKNADKDPNNRNVRRVIGYERQVFYPGYEYSARLVIQTMASPEAVSPKDWTMVLSLRPTFTWIGDPTVAYYQLLIYSANSNGILDEENPIHKLDLSREEVCREGICSFKPRPIRDGKSSYIFELSSGVGLRTGGYGWRVIALNENRNKTGTGTIGTFQIPSLGGDWSRVFKDGLCTCLAYDKNGVCTSGGNASCRDTIANGANNEYWNKYDDLIYRYAEDYDVSPSIMKAIMVGEAYAFTPVQNYAQEILPPTRTYVYEPWLDYKSFDNTDGIPIWIPQISLWFYTQPQRPPTQPFCGNGTCDIQPAAGPDCLGISFGGLPDPNGKCFTPLNSSFGSIDTSIINFCNNTHLDPQYTHACDQVDQAGGGGFPAQYRISASYGLGQYLYITEWYYRPFQDMIKELMKEEPEAFNITAANPDYQNFTLSEGQPKYAAPEWLYNEAFGVKATGWELNFKRCYFDPTLTMASDPTPDQWETVIIKYAGGDVKSPAVINWATNYTAPRSLVTGVSDYIIETAGHFCPPGSTRSAVNTNDSQSTISLKSQPLNASFDLFTKMEAQQTQDDLAPIYQRTFDLEGNIGQVQLVLLSEVESTAPESRMRIYQDSADRPLLWESDPLVTVFPFGFAESIVMDGSPIIIAYWADGAHSVRAYPILWDGTAFRILLSSDEQGESRLITSDEPAIELDSEGYLVSHNRSYLGPYPSSESEVWEFNGSEFNRIRSYRYLTDGSDTTPPMASVYIRENWNQNAWFQPDVHIDLSAVDNNAVMSIAYLLKNNAYTEEKTIPLDNVSLALGEGLWQLSFRTTDVNMNVEESMIWEFPVDGTPPEVSYQIDGQESNGWYQPGAILTFSASDPMLLDGSYGSGVDRIEYSGDGGDTWDIYSDGIIFSEFNSGVNTILYRAVDMAGNQSQVQSLEIKIGMPVASDLYLHGSGATANPPTLFLDADAPTATSAKYKDSASVNFNGGNPWKEVGTWTAAPSLTGGNLLAMTELHVWLGLKNSDDIGTRFDLRAEVYRNDGIITSGETLCITNITRNPDLAKEVLIALESFDPVNMNGTTDALSIKLLVRVGTNGSGGLCGGHSNAVGARVYFDSQARPAKFGDQLSFLGYDPLKTSAALSPAGLTHEIWERRNIG